MGYSEKLGCRGAGLGAHWWVSIGPDASTTFELYPWVSLYWLATGRTVGEDRCIPTGTFPVARKHCGSTSREVQLVFQRKREEGSRCA